MKQKAVALIVRHGACWLFLATVGACLFALSYGKWGDPLIDLGRDLYLARALLDGRILYREIVYNYGPVAPYALAGITGLLGDSLAVFAGIGVATGLIVMAGLYAIGCRLQGRTAGTACAAAFLVLSFFNRVRGGWGMNFVLPYSYAVAFGMACAVWSFYLLLRFGGLRERSRAYAASVVLAVLAALCKQDVALAILGTHAIAWFVYRVPWRWVAAEAVAGAVVAAGVAATFAARAPGEHALFAESLFKYSGLAFSHPFFKMASGADDWQRLLPLRLLDAVTLAAPLVLVNLPAWTAPRVPARARHILTAAAVFAAVVVLWFAADSERVAGLVPAAVATIAWLACRRRWRDPLWLSAGFALLASVRVLLNFHPFWFGSFFCIPGYVFAVHLGVRAIRVLPARRASAAVLLALGLLMGFRFVSVNRAIYRKIRFPVATPKGVLFDGYEARSECLNEFLEYMLSKNASDASSSLAVIPEGVSLNYFLDLPNPTAYYLFTPLEMADPAVEKRMLGEFRAGPPDCVLLTSRPMTDFPEGRFGSGYGRGLAEWITRDYTLERRFVAEDERGEYVMVLWRQRGD